MSLSQWELFWWRTKIFTQPQPKYYAYQEELRYNPLIERSINLITLGGNTIDSGHDPLVRRAAIHNETHSRAQIQHRVVCIQHCGLIQATGPEGCVGCVCVCLWMMVREEEWLSAESSRTWTDRYNKLWKHITQGEWQHRSTTSPPGLIRPSSLNRRLSKYYT